MNRYEERRELPMTVQHWYGFTTATGIYTNEFGIKTSLAFHNDGVYPEAPKSFKQIAKIIRREPEGLCI